MARRSGSDWWVGSLNNGTERDLKLELDFLSEGDYQATIYTDAEDVERKSKQSGQTGTESYKEGYH